MKTNVKIELTIDNMVNFLNQQNYTTSQLTSTIYADPNRFRLGDFIKVSKVLLDHFFTDYKEEDFDLPPNYYQGSVILINEKMKLKWMKDISYIEFTSLYPNIIIKLNKLWKENKLKFSVFEFGIIYTFLVENRKLISINPNIKEESKLLCKVMINYLYGASSGQHKFPTRISNVDSIPHYTRETLESLFEIHKDNIAYIDTDQIFLDFVSPEILDNYIKPLGLPYTIKHNIDCMFIEKKKYLMDELGTLKVRGIVEWRSKYKAEKLRFKKINKIVSIIRSNENHENPSSV